MLLKAPQGLRSLASLMPDVHQRFSLANHLLCIAAAYRRVTRQAFLLMRTSYLASIIGPSAEYQATELARCRCVTERGRRREQYYAAAIRARLVP
jgi:hypothetical protein